MSLRCTLMRISADLVPLIARRRAQHSGVLYMKKRVFGKCMKSFLLAAFLFLGISLVASCSDSSSAVNPSDKPFTVHGEYYDTLQEAVDNASGKAAGGGPMIKMLKDATGKGAIIDKNVVIDFGSYTYTFSGVNSTSQQNAGILVLANVTDVVIKSSKDSNEKTKTFAVAGKNGETQVILKILAPVSLDSIVVDSSLDYGSGEKRVKKVIEVSGENGEVVVQGNSKFDAASNQMVLSVEDGARFVMKDDSAKIKGPLVVTSKSTLELKQGSFTVTSSTITGSPVFRIDSSARFLSADSDSTSAIIKYTTESSGSVRCLSHKFGPEEILVPAKEGSPAKIRQTCEVCGFVSNIERSTCVNGQHSWRATTSKSDCAVDAYVSGTCLKCGVTTDTLFIPSSANHEWSQWTVIVEASCETDSVRQRGCTVCTTSQTETVEGSALGHDWILVVSRTNCEVSETLEHVCSRCDAHDEHEVEAVEHIWGSHETHDATCSADGITTETCLECGHTSATVIPATGVHTFDWTGDVFTSPSTCSVKGYKLTTCTVCDDATTVTELELDSSVHTFDWDGDVFTSPSTCIVKGYKLTTCTECGDATTVTTLDLDGNAHVYSSEWSSDTQSHWHDASCGHESTSEYASHAWDRESASPGEGKIGYTTDTCSVCGYTSATEVAPTDSVLKLDGVYYNSLAEAMAYVNSSSGNNFALNLTADIDNADGFIIGSGKNVTIDFAGHSYVVTGFGAGTSGNSNNAFFLKKGSTVVFKNGFVSCGSGNTEIKSVIYSLGDLTLDGMEIDGTNLAHDSETSGCLVSSYLGSLHVSGTDIIATSGDYALDCGSTGSTKASIVVSGDSQVTGMVSLTGGDITLKSGAEVSGCVTAGQNVSSGTSGSVFTIESGATVRNENKNALAVFGSNTLNISGKVIGSVSTNMNSYNSDSVINVYDGAEILCESEWSDADVAVYLSNGTLNVYGGTIQGQTALYVKSRVLNIEGGSFVGNGAASEFVHSDDGCSATGAAIVIENCGSPSGLDAENISISGGSFRGVNAEAVQSYGYGDYSAHTGFVTGGSFSSDPCNATGGNLVASGYTTESSGGMYIVVADD